MNEERIITAGTVTTGEKTDGKQLQSLIEKSMAAGLEVKTVIGDAAYSDKVNIAFAKERNIALMAKLNPSVTQGYRKKEDEFEFNKDAGMYDCKAGHLAVRKARQGKRMWSQRDRCYKPDAKSKSYSISIKSDNNSDQAKFQETEYFKEKSKEQYKMEAKNSELKHRYGYDISKSSGLVGMQMQGPSRYSRLI